MAQPLSLGENMLCQEKYDFTLIHENKDAQNQSKTISHTTRRFEGLMFNFDEQYFF